MSELPRCLDSARAGYRGLRDTAEFQELREYLREVFTSTDLEAAPSNHHAARVDSTFDEELEIEVEIDIEEDAAELVLLPAVAGEALPCYQVEDRAGAVDLDSSAVDVMLAEEGLVLASAAVHGRAGFAQMG
jgi:hypothetical protein